MADVFLSYDSDDRAIAEKIANGLSGAGFSVWWDRHIRAGVNFSLEIKKQIAAARVVVVLWSVRAEESAWVLDEATSARDANKLIPVRIDGNPPPLGFRQFHALDFQGWNGDPTASAFATLLDSLRHFLDSGSAGAPPEIPPTRAAAPARRTANRRRLVVVIGIVVIGVLALVLLQPRLGTWTASGASDGRVEIGEFEPLTKTDELQRVAQGLTDTMVRVFATNDLKTVARNQTSGADAEFTVRGSVDRDGDKLVVNADLVNQRERLVLWSTTMRHDAAESPLLQQRFSISMAGALRCALRVRRAAKNDPATDLFALFLRICDAIPNGKIDSMVELERRIVEAAPQYAVSYALVAQGNAAVSTLFGFRPEAEQERLRKATYDNAKRALELDPNGLAAALANFALGIVDDAAVGLAQREKYFQKAIELDPGEQWAYWGYATLLLSVGRIEDARTYFMRGATIDPLQYGWIAEAAYLTAGMGDIHGARDQFREAKSTGAYSNDFDVPLWFDVESVYGDPEIARRWAVANPSLARECCDRDIDASNCLNAFLDARTRHVVLSEDQIETACAAGYNWNPLWVHGYFGHVDWVFNDLKSNRDAPWYPMQEVSFYLPEMRAVRADPRFMQIAATVPALDYWIESDRWPDFCKHEKLPYDCKEAALAARAATTK